MCLYVLGSAACVKNDFDDDDGGGGYDDAGKCCVVGSSNQIDLFKQYIVACCIRNTLLCYKHINVLQVSNFQIKNTYRTIDLSALYLYVCAREYTDIPVLNAFQIRSLWSLFSLFLHL